MTQSPQDPRERFCGACTLCCTVLRVDELRKLGGVACAALDAGGCTIYARRPHICRAYRCLWLQGKLDLEDRPDRLGAVLDLAHEGASTLLAVREAIPGASDANPRLAAIVARWREAMPVRITRVADVLRDDAPARTLLAGGEEIVVCGDSVVRLRAGTVLGQRRATWPERLARRSRLAWQRWRVRGYGDGAAALPRDDA
jgi:Fe-S-cluster containining protein